MPAGKYTSVCTPPRVESIVLKAVLLEVTPSALPPADRKLIVFTGAGKSEISPACDQSVVRFAGIVWAAAVPGKRKDANRIQKVRNEPCMTIN